MSKARDLANASGGFSTISPAEISYLDGLSGFIQTQIDSKSTSFSQTTEPTYPVDGQIWVDTDGNAPGTSLNRWSKVLTSTSTTISGIDNFSATLSYSPGYEQVYFNGVYLTRGTDYTATTGTTIVLTNAPVVGDQVEVISGLQIAITDTYSQTAANSLFAANANQFVAGKNKIINGDFGINQRSFTTTSTSTTYGFDRWFIGFSGGTVTYSAQTFTVGAAPTLGYEGVNYARVVTASQSAASDFSYLQQRIESVRTFAGQTVTVSFWARAASGTPNLGIVLEQQFGAGGSSTVVISGGVNALTTSWARYSATIAVPSIAGKTIGTGAVALNLGLMTSVGSTISAAGYPAVGIQNTTIDIWGVQIEAGSTVTPFTLAGGGFQGAELSLCQRYYYRNTAGTLNAFMSPLGVAQSTTQIDMAYILPITMRGSGPTSVETNGLTLTDNVSTIICTGTFTLLSTTYNPNTPLLRYTHGSAALTQYRTYLYQANNSATAYIGFSAEL